MIEAIDKKYCIGNFVQLMQNTDVCHLIVSADEIILLKVGDKVLVNKYDNYLNRNLFPYYEEEQDNRNRFPELFEYNKIYLNFKGSMGGFCFNQDYFFKGNDRALVLEDSLPVDDRNAVKNCISLDRQEIEEIFDSKNYDSMYVINRNGRISFARNNNNRINIGKNVIPSDDEIVEMELKDRKGNYYIAKAINPKNDTIENYHKANTPKTIDEIREFKLYGPTLLGIYSDMLLTVKDGNFDLKWFKIDFIEKNKFRLTTSPIAIVEPTVDDVLNYAKEYDIKYTPEPSETMMTLDQIYISEVQTMANNTENSVIDNDNQEEQGKGKFKKFLKKLKR